MDRLNISQYLRYFSIGAVLWFQFYLLWPELAESSYNTLDKWGAALAALVFGSIFYFAHRSLVYNDIIIRFQDSFRWRTHNYRTFLRLNYPRISIYDAMFLNFYLKRKLHKDNYNSSMEIVSSGIHLLYMSGTSCLLSLIIMLFRILLKATYCRHFCTFEVFPHQLATITFLYISMVTLHTAGFLLDRKLEDYEYRLFLSINSQYLNDHIGKFAQRRFATERQLSTLFKR